MDITPDEFPILCETCLGPNPYIRMTREKHARACHICDRPFTVFRWKPGTQPGMQSRYKKTELCPTCAKLKNVCQTCILDLQFGLPVEVRDKALELEGQEKADIQAVSHANRNFIMDQIETSIKDGSGRYNLPTYGPLKSKTAQMLINRVQRRGPYFKRNEPHVCSFFIRGKCNRGLSCPYKHPKKDQMPKSDDPLADQNIKDRFYGMNDPVAAKLMQKHEQMKQKDNEISLRGPPPAPEDDTIRTIFISGIDETVSDDNLREMFSSFGPIQSVHIVAEKKIGFVTYAHRQNAEEAIAKLYDCLFVSGRRLRLDWGKSRRRGPASGRPMPGPPGMPAPAAAPHFSAEDRAYLASQGIHAPQAPNMGTGLPIPGGSDSVPASGKQPAPPPGQGGPKTFYPSQVDAYGSARFQPSM